MEPSLPPSQVPSRRPSNAPSQEPSYAPSQAPSLLPSTAPSSAPTQIPSFLPTFAPSQLPSSFPTQNPSLEPSKSPSYGPSFSPSLLPSAAPSQSPSLVPSVTPTQAPSFSPTRTPSQSPSASPSLLPSSAPSFEPTKAPTTSTPTSIPTSVPTSNPPLPFIQLSNTGNVYAVSQFSPSLGNITGNYLAGQTLTTSIIDLIGTSTISYTLGSVSLPAQTVVSTYTYPSPANIVGILKTSTVYAATENSASTVYVMYSVTDSFGRSQCSPASVTVSLTVGVSSSTCTVFSSPAVPTGSCSLVVSSGLFALSAVTLPVSISLTVSSVLVQTTSLGNVTLAPNPSQTAPITAGLYFQMPIYAAVPGDTITVGM